MFIEREIMEQPKVLSDCLAANRSAVQAIVGDLNGRDLKSVIIAARGTSDHAAIYAKYCMEIIKGIPVALAAPSVVTLYKRKMNYKDSLVIGISQSGEARDVKEVLEQANAQHACTIAVTNFIDSPLAQCASHHLWCSAGREKSVAATKTFMAEMYLLISLAAHWDRNEELIRALEDLPGMLEKQLKTKDRIKEAVECYKFAEQITILARGLLYPVALEAALKIQETNYLMAKAYSISDFYHGPLAMIERNTPVVILSGNDAAKQDSLAAAGKLKEMGADILLVTDTGDCLDTVDAAIQIPASDPFLAPFHFAAAMQLFAFYLALRKGMNPDEPRNLKKVTITR